MSTYEFTATITAAGQIEVPHNLVHKLPIGKQAWVSVTIGEESSLPPGTPGKELLKLAGLIPPDDLKQMSDAIKEEFEKIDVDE